MNTRARSAGTAALLVLQSLQAGWGHLSLKRAVVVKPDRTGRSFAS